MESTFADHPVHYGAYEGLIDLSKHYLGEEDTTTLKTGFWGYITHAMSKIAADSAFHRNMLYREMFLNTASFPASIYNAAKLYGYEVGNAVPATARVLITFKEKDLDDLFDDANTGNTLTIPSTQSIHMEDVPFIVAAAINIHRNGRQFTADYSPTDRNFPVPEPWIRTSFTDRGGERFHTFEIILYQAQRQFNEFTVLSTDPIEVPRYMLDMDDPDSLAQFRMEYRPPSEDGRVIPLYFNDTFVPDDREYGYYRYGYRGIEIVFSSLPNEFRPEYNSRLILTYYTTRGAGGNFTFDGIPSMQVESQEGKRFSPSVEMILSHPSGGRNRPSLTRIKSNIIEQFGFRDSIITENDFTTWLQREEEKIGIENTVKIQFRKRQDDLMVRRFTAYLAMRMNEGRMIPGNTCGFDVPASNLDDAGGTLLPGTAIVFDRSLARSGRSGVFRLLEEEEDGLSYLNNGNEFLYSLPYLMSIRRDPFPRATLYDVFTNSSSPVSIASSESNTEQRYFINSVSVRRLSTDEDYRVEVVVNSNLADKSQLFDGSYQIKVIIRNDRRSKIGEVLMTPQNERFHFLLSTDEQFTSDGRLLITSDIYENAGLDSSTVQSTPSVPETIHLSFQLRRRDGNGRFTGTPLMEYRTDSPLRIYRNLERMIHVLTTVNDDGDFHCKDVPLIGSRFFSNNILKEEIIKILGRYYSSFESMLDHLENNTSMDMKLFNTFGPAVDFSSDRTSISMRLDIQVDGARTVELKNRIIERIMLLVEEGNSQPVPDLRVSYMTHVLHTEIPQIRRIDVKSINGTTPGRIHPIYSDDVRESLPDYVPEYLNVAMIGSQGVLVPDIVVNFVD